MKWTWFCTVVEMFRPSFKGEGQWGYLLHFARISLPPLPPLPPLLGTCEHCVRCGNKTSDASPSFQPSTSAPSWQFYLCMLCILSKMYTLLNFSNTGQDINLKFICCENWKGLLINYSWWSLGGPLYDFCIVTSLQPSANFCLLQITDKQTNGAVSCSSHTHP